MEYPEQFTTSEFSISPNDYLKIETKRWLSKYWCIPLLPIIALFLYGVIFDIRFLLLSLILLFVIVPKILLLVYFSRALNPEIRQQLIKKQIIVNPEKSLQVIFIPADEDHTSASSPSWQIPWTDIQSISRSGRHLILDINTSKQLLIIPLDALPSRPLASIFFKDVKNYTWQDS